MSITKEDLMKLRSFVKSAVCVDIRIKAIKKANEYLRQKKTDKDSNDDVLISI